MERAGEREPLRSEGSEQCTITYVHMGWVFDGSVSTAKSREHGLHLKKWVVVFCRQLTSRTVKRTACLMIIVRSVP